MRQLCFIGDSHVAALKVGWPLVEHEFPDLRIDFFGAARQFLADLLVADGKLIAPNPILANRLWQTSGRASEIGGGYAAYVVCGLGCRTYRLRPLYQDFRAERQQVDHRTPISDACYLESVIGTVHTTTAAGMLAKIRQISSAPATLLATPMVAASEAEIGATRERKRGGDRIIADFFHAACARVADALGCSYVPQPAQTLASAMRTKAHFAQSPARFAFDEAEPDRNHMNAAYGAIVLREVLATLDGR